MDDTAEQRAEAAGEASARDALRDARTTLAQAHAYRYRMVATSHGMQAGPGAADSTAVTVTGEVRGDDVHVREEDGIGTSPSEIVVLGGGYYLRTPAANVAAGAFSTDQLVEALKDRRTGEDRDRQEVAVVAALYLGK